MARITVDDCLRNIPNRFEMTLAATARARQLANGANPMVDANRDNGPSTLSLRSSTPGARRRWPTSSVWAIRAPRFATF